MADDTTSATGDDTPADDQAQSQDAQAAETQDDKPLGPEGERALAVWKDRAKAAENKAKRADQLEQELTKFREQQMSEQERAIEQAKREAAEATRNEVLGGVREELFASAVAAASAGRVADPGILEDPVVARKLLGLDDIPLNDAGQVDRKAVQAAVDQLLTTKTYLAAPAANGRPATGSADQGARATAPTPTSMNDLIRGQLHK